MARKQKPTDEAATLITHVRELQIRLLITAVVLVGAGTAAWFYYGQILDLLRSPLNAPLYYNSVSGSFSFIMKICMVAGIAVSVPLIIYNFIMFIRPAFVEVFTIKRVILMTLGSILAAAGGMVFGFLFIIPGALHFFSGFQVHGLHELISADSYLNFVINVLITFILMFQLPLVVSLIDKIKPISPRAMWKGEKWALVGSIVIALIVPFAMDFMTQVLIAAPIFLLYNLSFVVVSAQHAYNKRHNKKVAKIEARVARKTERLAAQHAPKKASLPMPVAAAVSLAPNPQLAETLELLARQAGPKAAKPVMAYKPAPIQKPLYIVKPVAAPVIKKPVAVSQARISMDGMSRPNRTQPAQVIRQAGAIQHAPERPGIQRPMRSLNLMADIRQIT